MTIGERLAALRKEKGMSQESLGEAMGVSRQAISKWESDASMPEIDKLVALSRLFGVSVGYLLGVEEEDNRSRPEELTEEQLRMAERIAGKYIEAFPPPPAPGPMKLPKWIKLAAVAVAVVLASLLYYISGLSDDIGNLRRANSEIQNRVNQISSNVDWATSNMTERMEEILKKQNAIVADYGSRVEFIDYGTGESRILLYAVPREYTEGMTAAFSVDDREYPAVYEGGKFVAAVDADRFADQYQIDYYVHFDRDGTRQTHQLEDLYPFEGTSDGNLYLTGSGDMMGMLWMLHAEHLNQSGGWQTSWNAQDIDGQVKASDTTTALYGEKFGFIMLKNQEVFYRSPVYDCPDGGENVFVNDMHTLYFPQINEDDIIQYVCGILDNYGNLHITEHWMLRADDEGRLDSFENDKIGWGRQDPDNELPEYAALHKYLEEN